MRLMRNFYCAVFFVFSMSGCGGVNQEGQEQTKALSTSAAYGAAPSEELQINALRSEYEINRIGSSYLLTDRTGARPSQMISNIRQLVFTDAKVRLDMNLLEDLLTENEINEIIDFYGVLLRRLPDASGLEYWARARARGLTVNQMADAFHAAAIQYSALTGRTATESKREFVLSIYTNVLGRNGDLTPSISELDYWVDLYERGLARGELVQRMLSAARSFRGDPVQGKVARLLDNRVQFARLFAIEQGLGFANPLEEIAQTMRFWAAVDDSGYSFAQSMLPVANPNHSILETDNGNLSRVCKPSVEQSWVRAHLDDVYLWYQEIKEQAFSLQTPVPNYFQSLLVTNRDKYSFVASKAEVDNYFNGGGSTGYGYSLLRQGTRLRVLFVQPNSPADRAGIKRGTTILAVDGTSLAQPANDLQFAALYPSTVQTHTFEVLQPGEEKSRFFSLSSSSIVQAPVLSTRVIDVQGVKVAYLVFNDHVRIAEQQLIDAINSFKRENISELVLDLRYNGGGYLYIANELAAMIGGNRSYGKLFEQLIYNDKHPIETAMGKSWFYVFDSKGRDLPWLSLKRVFVLTGNRTCSASESIINGLSPFVEVIQIGEQTCGKPYGFLQTDNCDKAYFAIRFSGVNAVGKGDYTEGLTPKCVVPDDLDHQLGDPFESRLSSALHYMRTNSCQMLPSVTTEGPPSLSGEPDPYPWRSIKLIH